MTPIAPLPEAVGRLSDEGKLVFLTFVEKPSERNLCFAAGYITALVQHEGLSHGDFVVLMTHLRESVSRVSIH